MCSILTFLIYLHFSSLCLSAPALFDNSDESAWDMFSQPDADADVGGLQSYSALDETSDINPQFFDGLNLGGADSDSHSDSDSSMFQPFDESSQDHQAIDSYQEIFAGKGNECSFNDLLPASRLRPRADWCEQKPDPAILNLKIPTLDNLPGRKLPSPGPLNSPSWQPLNGILFNRPEVENPQVCPMSFRNWYYIPVCGIRLGDQGKYSPTELNSLRGWTVTDASIWKIGFEVCFNPKQVWCCEKYYTDTRMAYPCETILDAWTWADHYEGQPGGGGFPGSVPNGAE